MKIKVIGKQIYDDYEEKIEQEFENAEIKLNDIIFVKYAEGEIKYNKSNNVVEIKKFDNNIIVELNKEKKVNYNTPYGIIDLKTFGENIYISENPFRLVITYRIIMNDTMDYKNIVEILNVD